MSDSGRIRVLIADDHAIVRKGIRAVLEIVPDIKVVGEAENGRDAVYWVEELKPDVILMDLVMPEMDGIELAQRCNELSPTTKVMFITGFAAVALKANRESTNARMLSKPFHLKDLVLEVERMFEDTAALSL